jgi:hypothetical protein
MPFITEIYYKDRGMHGDDDQIVPIDPSLVKDRQGGHIESLSGSAARHVLDS